MKSKIKQKCRGNGLHKSDEGQNKIKVQGKWFS
jgi:hypothetical protein